MSGQHRHPQLSWSRLACCLGAGVCCLVTSVGLSAEVDFYRDVYPILKANCIACHNKTTTKADLNMETPEFMIKGGESGAGLVPGKGADSLILQAAVHAGDVEMPPKSNKIGAKNLTPSEVAVLQAWIDQGAKGSIQQARQITWEPLSSGVNPIYAVAMTQDGRLAACGRASQIFVYDLALRQFVTRLTDDSLDNRLAPRGAGAAHRALVQSLAFSPDGLRLASGSFREVKIWRRESAAGTSRKPLVELGAVVSVVTGDGKQVVCADKQGVLHVVDAASAKEIKSIATQHHGGIARLCISPDASLLAVYGSDSVISVWNLQEGNRIANIPNVEGLRALAWTRDGKAIAAAPEDKIVRVWRLPVADNMELAAPQELKGATGPITALEAGADPDRLIAASEDGKVRLWSLSASKPAREFNIAGVVVLNLSRDGKQLATGCADGVVRVWNADNGKQIVELRGDTESAQRVAAVDWTIAAQGLEIAYQTQEVARIESQTKALDELLKKANETIAAVQKVLPEKQKALKLAQEGKEAAQQAADASATLITNAPEGKPDSALEKQNKEAQDKLVAATMAESAALAAVKGPEHHRQDAEAEVQHITAAKVKNSSAVAAANTALAQAKQVQDKATAELATIKQAEKTRSLRPRAVGFSPDAQSVAAVYEDGALDVWAIASGMPIAHLAGSAATTTASITHSADGTFVACSADGSTVSVSATSRWVLERVLGSTSSDSPFSDRVNAVRFSPDGRTLAAGSGEPSRSGDISLWDVASGKAIQTWKERHSDTVLCLEFSPDGKLIASGGADKMARISDIASGKQVSSFEGHTHHVMGVAIRADGRVLASAGADNVVIVWDLLSGERMKKIEGWGKEVTSLQFIGATSQIVTSAGDNLIRIVNTSGAEVRAISKLPEFMQSAASTATGNVIIGGGEDGLLRVWDGTNGQELAIFGANQVADKTQGVGR